MEISVIVNKAVAGLVKSANNPIATLMIANPILLMKELRELMVALWWSLNSRCINSFLATWPAPYIIDGVITISGE